MPEGFAPVENGRLWYEIRGFGPPVILIHAGLWDARTWDDQMEPFSRGHRVVRYDLRGFGRSDRFDRPFSERRDLAQLMDHLGLESAALVGASIGGALAVDFAIEYPNRVNALVLVAPGLSGDDTPDTDEMERIWKQAQAAKDAGDLEGCVDLELEIWTPLRTDPEVDRRIRHIAQDNRHELTLEWRHSQGMEPPAAGRLGEVRVPTLLILGDSDAPVMGTIADRIVAGIPGTTRAAIPGADHLPNMRRPAEFDRIVLEFLAGNGL
jgi:pimeloyl-ACP methyl ester carboxylesterase